MASPFNFGKEAGRWKVKKESEMRRSWCWKGWSISLKLQRHLILWNVLEKSVVILSPIGYTMMDLFMKDRKKIYSKTVNNSRSYKGRVILL